MKELTPMMEAKKQITELWSSPSDQPTYSQIFEILDKQELKEKEQIEIYENLLDEISASIGNEYRLPRWIESTLNYRMRAKNTKYNNQIK